MNLELPFGSKELADGRKLYRRKHGYLFSHSGGTGIYEIVVPYAYCKTNQAELMGCPAGCTANFKVLDTVAGLYTNFPNYVLDQFGYNVNISKDSFRDTSEYEADLRIGMRVVIELTSDQTFNFGVNIVFHEVK